MLQKIFLKLKIFLYNIFLLFIAFLFFIIVVLICYYILGIIVKYNPNLEILNSIYNNEKLVSKICIFMSIAILFLLNKLLNFLLSKKLDKNEF